MIFQFHVEGNENEPEQDLAEDDVSREEGISSFSFLAAPETEICLEESPLVDSVQQSKSDDIPDSFSFLDQPVADPKECAVTKGSISIISYNESTKSPSLPVESDATSAKEATKTSQRSVGNRLTPGTGEKKKKKKAIRPGQNVSKEDDADAHIPLDNTKYEQVALTEADKSLELPSVTLQVDVSRPTDTNLMPHPINSPSEKLTPSVTPAAIESEDVEQKSVVVPLETKSSHEEERVAECAGAGDAIKTVDESEGTPLPKEIIITSPVNYAIQFSHEESLAGLLQSYASGLLKLR